MPTSVYVEDNLKLFDNSNISIPRVSTGGLTYPFVVSTSGAHQYINQMFEGPGSASGIIVTNSDSILAIKTNGVISSPWADLPLNGSEEIMVRLKSGYYMTAYRDSNYYWISWYNNLGQLLTRGGVPFIYYSECIHIGYTVTKSSDDKIIISRYQVNQSNSTTYLIYIGAAIGNNYDDTWIQSEDLSPVIVYDWEPFERLTGNEGQFQMDLSQIDKTIIGDGSTQTSSTDASKFILTDRTSLYSLSVNMLDGQEYTIAYCGDNYLNMKKRTVVGDQSTVIYVTLKFYFRSDVLVYTSDEMQIIRIGTTFPNDYYLSIIYDDENEVAALDCINHFSNVYYYNNFSLPSDEQMRALYIWLQDNGNAQSSDPYGTGSTDDGGDPEGPRQQDNITDAPLPTCGGLELGLVTLYRPTDAQLGQIASFLWSDNVLDNFKKYFNNFADNILSLYALPFTPSNLQTKTFKVGNLTSEIAGVEYCTVRYFDIDMGQLEVKNQWGSYLDYSPYTKMEIYLPYLGLHSLDADEIMSPARMDGSMPDKQGTVLSLVYRLDILTGIIVAKIKVRVYKKNGTYSDEIRYQFSGRVGSICPLTGQTYAGYIQTAAVEFTGLVSTIASGGLAAPMAGAAAVTATVAAQKPTVERVGAVSGDASMMATNVPYLCISVPNKPYLDRQQKFTGFPSYKSGLLSDFSGFTQVIEAHVEGISCTEEERTKILAYLKEGVIL